MWIDNYVTAEYGQIVVALQKKGWLPFVIAVYLDASNVLWFQIIYARRSSRQIIDVRRWYKIEVEQYESNGQVM